MNYQHAQRSRKPPKLRFRPGQKFIDPEDGVKCELICCFRTEPDTQEWQFWLEEIDEKLRTDAIARIAAAVGLGDSTPRISYAVLRDTTDAHKVFADIPVNGDWRLVRNRDLLKWRKIDG